MSKTSSLPSSPSVVSTRPEQATQATQSTIRRKPNLTYKSPSAHVAPSLRIEGTVGAVVPPSASTNTSSATKPELTTRLCKHPALHVAPPKAAAVASEAIRVIL